MIYTLKNARKAKDTELVHHEIEGEVDRIYRTLRVGLSWPENTAPAYFCIIGETHRQNEFKRYPLIFLAEGESVEGFSVLDLLIDRYKMVLCSGIWADLTEDKRIFRDVFHDHCIENEVKGVYLQPAPWPDQFAYGLNLIRNWIEKKSLEVQKDSILARQLGRLPQDLKAYSSNPEQDFYAVNALRYVLGSFQKHPHRADIMKDIDYGDPENYPGYYPGIPI